MHGIHSRHICYDGTRCILFNHCAVVDGRWGKKTPQKRFYFCLDFFFHFSFICILLCYYKILLFYCEWQCNRLWHFTETCGLHIWLVAFQHRRAMHVEHLRSAVLVVAVALVVLYRQFELGKSSRSPGARDLNCLARTYRRHSACYGNIYNLNPNYSCPSSGHTARIPHDTTF